MKRCEERLEDLRSRVAVKRAAVTEEANRLLRACGIHCTAEEAAEADALARRDADAEDDPPANGDAKAAEG